MSTGDSQNKKLDNVFTYQDKDLEGKHVLIFQKSGNIGGAEINLERWVTHFIDNYGMKFSLCGPGDGVFFDQMKDLGVSTYKVQLPDWRKGKNFLLRYWAQANIEKTLRNVPLDLIFSNDFFYSPYAVDIAIKKKRPSIIHIQSDCAPNRIRQYHLNNATKVLTTTRYSINKLSSQLSHDQLDYAPCIIQKPVKLEKIKSPNLYHKDNGNLSFGIAANILPHKGTNFFIELLTHLKNLSGWEIHWVGSDPQGIRSHLKKQSDSLGMSDRITFHGFEREMNVFYRSIDCLLHPAQFETFGIVIAEAMSYKLPVIATATEGAKEILGSTSTKRWIVSLDRPENMAKMMIQLIKNKERIEDEGNIFYQNYLKNYDSSLALDHIKKIFLQTLDKGVF